MNAGASPQKTGSWWKPWTWKQHSQILAGLLVGALGGWLLAGWGIRNADAQTPAIDLVSKNPIRLICDTGGTLFLNGLKVIVIPLVTSSIVLSVASIGQRSGFARLGVKTLAYFLSTSVAAILLGLFLVNTFQPGVTSTGQPLFTPENMGSIRRSFDAEAAKLKSSVEMERSKSGETLIEKMLNVVKRLVPSNPVQAMVEMDLLGLIVLSLLVGYFLGQLAPSIQPTMHNFWQGVYEISFSMTNLVLQWAPIGIGMLLASTVSVNYVTLAGDGRVVEFVNALKVFGVVSVTALLLHLIVVLPLVLVVFTRLNPWRFFKATSPALLTAFSTSSSNATLSVSLDCVEHRAGVSKEIGSFVVPVGATVNMNGTALYECVAAMFVVQLFGLHTRVDLGEQMLVVLIALLTSVGVAGVPSASLVAIVIILDSVTKQLRLDFALSEALPILLILDRPLDMLRTAVNVAGDMMGAVIIAKSEGESPLSDTNLIDRRGIDGSSNS